MEGRTSREGNERWDEWMIKMGWGKDMERREVWKAWEGSEGY